MKWYWYAIPDATNRWALVTGKFTVNEPVKAIDVCPMIYCGDELYPAGGKDSVAASETAWFDDVVVTITRK